MTKKNKLNQQEHIDFIGLSASISRFARNSALTFGFSYSGGSGDAQVTSDSQAIQSVSAQALSVFMSATYSY